MKNTIYETDLIGKIRKLDWDINSIMKDECIHTLEELSQCMDYTAIVNAVSPKQIENMRNFWNSYETEKELKYANDLLENADSPKALVEYSFYRRYDTFISEEGKLAELHKGKNVLFLGSGPLPLSAILLTEKFGVSMTCVDSDTKAVETSRSLIKHFGYEHSISVHEGLAQEADCSSYDAIWVAALVLPKKEVFAHLGKISPKTSIVARVGEGVRSIIYENIPESSLKYFKILDKYTATGDIKNSSLLLQTNYLR